MHQGSPARRVRSSERSSGSPPPARVGDDRVMRSSLLAPALALLPLLVLGCGSDDASDTGSDAGAGASDSGGGGTTDATTGGGNEGGAPGTNGGDGGTDSGQAHTDGGGAGGDGGTNSGSEGGTGPTSCTGATVGVNTDLHGYRFFPDGHPLNTPIDSLTKNTYSDAWKKTCAGGNGTIRPDYSMPYNVAPASTPGVTATALQYNGTPYDNPWLIPADATLEGGPYTAGADGDHHCLVLSLADCQSYETYQHLWGDSGHTTFSAVSGTIWSTAGTGSATSSGADAAGLPILPTIIREDELVAGAIHHALRFTCQQTLHGYIAPARAFASGQTDATMYAPMGARARLVSGFDVTKNGSGVAYSSRVQALFTAMKTYGIINADNGSGFFITATPNLVTDSPRVWTDDDDAAVKAVTLDNIEFVDSGTIVTTE